MKKKKKTKDEVCNWYDVDETGQFGWYDTDCGLKRVSHDHVMVDFEYGSEGVMYEVDYCLNCERRVNQNLPKGME